MSIEIFSAIYETLLWISKSLKAIFVILFSSQILELRRLDVHALLQGVRAEFLRIHRGSLNGLTAFLHISPAGLPDGSGQGSVFKVKLLT